MANYASVTQMSSVVADSCNVKYSNDNNDIATSSPITLPNLVVATFDFAGVI